MSRLIPSDAPDPDGDRRFAEGAFPLLEPVGWRGRRHRGEYGVAEPGGTTIALGLVFGPWDPVTTEPRLAVTVGSSFPISVTGPRAAFLLRSRLVARRAQLMQRPDEHERAPLRTVAIEIEREAVEVDVLGEDDRWVAQGSWRRFAVEIRGVGLEPASVRLQLARQVPSR